MQEVSVNGGVRSKIQIFHWLAYLFLLLVTGVVAFPHFSGDVLFIGDSDRLNTFLSIKLAEVINLKEFGYIAAWNPRSFLGFNFLGLYWTLPGLQLDSYLHSFFPITNFYRNAGYVTFILLFLSMSFAYFYLYDLTRSGLASVVGACCYGLSSLSLGRLAQVDTAYYTIVLVPFAMYSVRNLCNDGWRVWGVALALCMSVMLGMAFLQESAYVLLLIGAYSVYTAVSRRSWRPIFVLTVAFLGAVLIAGPRLLGVSEEFSLMFRTSNPSGTSGIEILRLFNDGIFGRYFEEAWSVIGNRGFNGHEGVQLYSSTIATCLLFLLVLLVDIRRHFWPLIIFLLVITLIVDRESRLAGFVMGILLCVFIFQKMLAPKQSRPIISIAMQGELAFHLCAFSVVLAFVLLPMARNIIYLLFMKVDFLHARIVVAAMLPFAAIVTLILAGFSNRVGMPSPTFSTKFIACCSFLLGVLVIVAIQHFVFQWQEGLLILDRKVQFGNLNLSRAILLQIILVMVLLFILLVIFYRLKLGSKFAYIIYFGLCAAIISEGFLYAKGRLFGEHTMTFPIAFRGYNYLTTTGDQFKVPSQECQRVLGTLVESDRYRSVSIGDPEHYYAFTGPHLSQFWQLRLIDGYPGLPKRLAELPWPPGIVGLRSLSFRNENELPWELLSLLGVKYALLVSDSLYFNTLKNSTSADGCGDGVSPKILKNPYQALPRQYFVNEIQSLTEGFTGNAFKGFNLSLIGPGEIELEWWTSLRDMNIEVLMRIDGEKEYSQIAKLSPMDSGRVRKGGLIQGKRYSFMLRKKGERGTTEELSRPINIDMPKVDGAKPKVTRVVRNERTHATIYWSVDSSHHAKELNIELRDGIDGKFYTSFKVPAYKGSAQIKLPEPVESLAIRIQVVSSDIVSPHSELIKLGTEAQFYAPLLKEFFGNNPRRTALVEGPVRSAIYSDSGQLNTSYNGDNVSIRFEPKTEDRFLVINEMFHPRWVANVDGKVVKIFIANRVMMGLIVPAGAREVNLEFRPILRSLGAVLSIGGGLIIVLAIFFIGFGRVQLDKFGTKGSS